MLMERRKDKLDSNRKADSRRKRSDKNHLLVVLALPDGVLKERALKAPAIITGTSPTIPMAVLPDLMVASSTATTTLA